jgi:FolB domain-containing protein
MTDRVFVKGLESYCLIGVQGWEREVKQKVIVDLAVECDCHRAGATDRLEDALDYRAVSKCVLSLVGDSSFLLVEALAEAVASAVLSGFPRADAVTVTVSKPGAVRWAETVGVEVVRRRRDDA